MIVVVTYDVSTGDAAGRRRLRRVGRACLDYGQRVQLSVFECRVGEVEWTRLRARLLAEIDGCEDSLRFYYLGEDAAARTEHHGVRRETDLDGPLIA